MGKSFLQALFDNQVVGMVEVNVADQYLHANPHWLKMIGYSDKELRTINVKDVTHPEDYPPQLIYNQQLADNKISSYRMDKRYIRKDGSIIWADVSVTAVYDNNTILTGMIALVIDISKRKQIELDLIESEKRFRTLLDHLEHIPIQGYDKNRRVTYWNKASTEVYGYSRTEALGKQLENLIIPPAMRAEVISIVNRWLVENKPIPSGELILQNKNGDPVTVFSSHIIHTTSTGEKELFCVDIDLRMLQQTRGEIRKLVAAVEQSGETIVITDNKGIIEYVNPAFTTITGYSHEEAIGKNPRILNSGEQDQSVYAEMWETITHGEAWQGRFINKKKDGSRFIEDVTISPILGSNGEIINFVAAKRDITEQLQVEEKYQQAQKMEAIGQLAGGVAHDFNNMLAIIIGQVEIALLKTDLSDPIRKRLNEINVAATRSADLTRQLLGFARKQNHNPEILNLNDTIATTLAMLKRLIGEQLALNWQPESVAPITKIDPGHFNQILTNLIINARDAITGSGTITVKTNRMTFDSEFCQDHPGSVPGEYVSVEIRDTGCGIAADIIDKVFDPFFTTKGVGEGTGLGLSMVFGLVKQNNGYIVVHSTPNQGATFTIYFPIPKEIITDPETTETNELACGNETILVVEDELSLLDVTTSILTEAGYTIIPVDDPLIAINKAKNQSDKIQLLLTDVVLPKMNGIELSAQIGKIIPQIKTLYISGYPQNNFSQQDHFLPKPFSANKLTHKVREVLGLSSN